ncbi:MAG: aryl-sulfate sulfotransferase [Dehalococcoidia bacterium]
MRYSVNPSGIHLLKPGRMFQGYTLFSTTGGDDAYLVDMEGAIVHHWHFGEGINDGRLLPGGNLLFRTRGALPGLNASGAVVELDWAGNLVWEYRNAMLRRHNRLANGNNLFLLYEENPAHLTSLVRGGYPAPDDPKQMQGDLVVEATPDGTIVYEWRSWEHLDPEEDIICPLETRVSWGGANDLTALDDGSFLISFRILNTVARVDRDSSGFSWKWGKDDISHQHNPTLLSNGNVLLLDNGSHRRGLSYSRVVEVDPANGQIAWEYRGDPLVSFFTHFTGGAERLPNDNTLITEGAAGRIFEVTSRGEVVWEYLNPFPVSGPQGASTGVFRAHRYGPDDPALTGRDLDPARYPEFNRS